MAFSGHFSQAETTVIPDISFDPLHLLKLLKDHKIVSFSEQDQTSLFGSTSTSNNGLPISPHTFDALFVATHLPHTINQFENIIQRMKIEDYGAFLKFTGNLFAPQQQANLDYKQIISNFFILKILEKIKNKVLFNLSAEDASYLANFQQTVESLAKQDAQLVATANLLPNIYTLAKKSSETKIPVPLDMQTIKSLPPNSVIEINPYVLDERYVLEAKFIKWLMVRNASVSPPQIFIHHDGSIPNTIKAGVEYPLSFGDPNNEITIRVKFTNSLALYVNSDNYYRYTILEDTLGKGNYGEAVHAPKALASNKNGSFRAKKSHYDYVTKIIKNKRAGDPHATDAEIEKINTRFVESIMHEHFLGRKLSHLHAKAMPVFVYDNKGYITECHITMRKLKGVALSQHLQTRGITSQQAYKKDKQYTKEEIDNLLDQSINLMRGLKKVHNASIIHRDIKPENIIIDLITNKFYFFDLGLSKEKNTIHREFDGTPLNITPEQIKQIEQSRQANFRSQNITNESTDYWEFALTLAQIWGMGHLFGHHKNQYALYQDVLKGKLQYQDSHMSHLDELSHVDAHPHQLLYIINNLLHTDPLIRAKTWQDAQNMLETMRLDRCTPETRPAHELALKLRHKLDVIEIKKGRLSELFKVLEEIKQVCLTSDILDHPSALKEFNRVLGIKQLNKFTNKAAFQNHLDRMLEILRLAEKIQVIMSELQAKKINLPEKGITEHIFQYISKVNTKLHTTDSTPGKIIRMTEKLNYPFLSTLYDMHVLHREITAINPNTHPTFHAYLTELLEANLKKILISTPTAELRTATELPVIREYIFNHNDLFQATPELQEILTNLLLAMHEELSAKLKLHLSIPDNLLKDTDFLRELCKREIKMQSIQTHQSNTEQTVLQDRKEKLESELQSYINKYHEKIGKNANRNSSNFSSNLFVKQSATSPKNETITPEANNPPTLGNSSGGSTL